MLGSSLAVKLERASTRVIARFEKKTGRVLESLLVVEQITERVLGSLLVLETTIRRALESLLVSESK